MSRGRASVRSKVFIPHGNPFIVSIYRSSFIMGLIVLIMMAYFSICPTGISVVRSVIGVPNWAVISSIRFVENQTKSKCRSRKIAMEGSVYIMSVIDIYISPMMTKVTSMVVINVKSTKP